jgi:hypothetical protein
MNKQQAKAEAQQFYKWRTHDKRAANLVGVPCVLVSEEYFAALRASRDELLSALQMAHGVLFLLTDEVRALGHGAENIPAKVSAAISAATGQPS